MPKDEKRLTISGLVPGEKYAIQVRAVDKDDNSQWSPKYRIETIDDTAGGTRTPAPPALTRWEVDASGQYVAEWATVNENTDGTPSVTKMYELGLTASGGTEVVTPHYGAVGAVQTRSFNFGNLRFLFGGTIPTSISARLRVINSADTVSEWSEPLVASLPVPNPPKNVIATPTVDAIKISWEPPDDPIYLVGYRVYVGFTPDFAHDNVGLSNLAYQGAATNFTYGTASYNTDHYFKVVSISEPSLESTFVVPTPDPTKPISPYGPDDIAPLKITTFGFGTPALDRTTVTAPKANLTWEIQETADENKDISGFVVRWRMVGDENWRNSYFEKTARTGSVDLPQPFANYEFQIGAYDFVANYSEFSDIATLTGATAPPGQVTGVTSVPRWDGMKILWDESNESVKFGGFYEIQFNTTGTFDDNGAIQYSTGVTNIDITNLSSLTQYFYRVRAVDAANQRGPWSVTDDVTLPAFPVANASDGVAPSAAPQNVKATGGLNYVNVSWDRVQNNDAVWYEVFASPTSGFTAYDSTTFVGESTGTSLMVTNLANGAPLAQETAYYFKVRAMDVDCLEPGVSGPVSAQATTTLTQVLSTDLGINMAGENLYYNSSFDTDSDGSGVADYWRVYNNSSTTEPTTPTLVTGRDGFGKAQRIVWTGVNTSTKGIYSGDSSVLRPKTEYMLSFYARSNGGTGFNLGFNQAPTGTPVWIENPALSATVWQRYIVRFTTGATVDPANVFITIKGHTLNGGWIEFDDAQIEAGNTASAYKTGTVSIAKLSSGRMETAELIIHQAGLIKSNNYNPATRTGWALSSAGLNLYDGQVDASTLVSNTTITNNLYVGALLEVAAGGAIRSANYSNGSSTPAAGFRIDSVGIDIRTGTVAAGTFSAGTISSPDIRIGANGKITIDSTGSIQSNNYSSTTGWKISSAGIEMNDNNSKINVNALVTSTLTTTTLTLGSGGVIRSKDWATNGPVRWQLSETGLTMYGGTITGSTVITDQIYSASSETQGGITRRKFSINALGYAEFSGAYIYGNVIVGNGGEHFVQSADYNGQQGWRIYGNGTANFFNVNTWNARVYGGAIVGGPEGTYSYLRSANWNSQSSGWLIQSDGYAEFNGGSFRIGSGGGGLTWILDGGGGNAQIRFYNPGDTSRFSYIRSNPNGQMFEVRSAFGGAIEFWNGALWDGHNLVRIIQDAHVTQDLLVDNASTLMGEVKFGYVPGPTGTMAAIGVNGNGFLKKMTSSVRYKTDVNPMDIDVRQALKLEPKMFRYKEDVKNGYTHITPGFIAEDAVELGLDSWVGTTEIDGEEVPDTFSYQNWTATLQHICRSQQEEIDELKSQVAKLMKALDK